jgi:hypothetical protein
MAFGVAHLRILFRVIAMRLRITSAVLMIAVGCRTKVGVPSTDRELALLLAEESTRSKAIAQIVSSSASSVPRLLSWTNKPPSGLGPLEEHDLQFGMAEAFGRLRIKEAIPFLIRNISLNSFPVTNVWTRSSEVILQRLPCAAALIQIGPEASRAVIQAYGRRSLDANGRYAAIFVVSRVPGVPEAREFLHSALGDANMQRMRAEEGLGYLEKHP